jgi:hypothetical protein
MNIPEIKPAGQESHDDLLEERKVLAEYISLQSQLQGNMINYDAYHRLVSLQQSGAISKIMAKVYPAPPPVKPRGRKKAKAS